jgi:hypothetical protein
MVEFPVEIIEVIVNLACFDSGHLACSLREVSSAFRQVVDSSPNRFRVMAVTGHIRMSMLYDVLYKTPKPLRNVEHLFVSERDRPHIHNVQSDHHDGRPRRPLLFSKFLARFKSSSSSSSSSSSHHPGLDKDKDNDLGWTAAQSLYMLCAPTLITLDVSVFRQISTIRWAIFEVKDRVNFPRLKSFVFGTAASEMFVPYQMARGMSALRTMRLSGGLDMGSAASDAVFHDVYRGVGLSQEQEQEQEQESNGIHLEGVSHDEWVTWSITHIGDLNLNPRGNNPNIIHMWPCRLKQERDEGNGHQQESSNVLNDQVSSLKDKKHVTSRCASY